MMNRPAASGGFQGGSWVSLLVLLLGFPSRFSFWVFLLGFPYGLSSVCLFSYTLLPLLFMSLPPFFLCNLLSLYLSFSLLISSSHFPIISTSLLFFPTLCLGLNVCMSSFSLNLSLYLLSLFIFPSFLSSLSSPPFPPPPPPLPRVGASVPPKRPARPSRRRLHAPFPPLHPPAVRISPLCEKRPRGNDPYIT